MSSTEKDGALQMLENSVIFERQRADSQRDEASRWYAYENNARDELWQEEQWHAETYQDLIRARQRIFNLETEIEQRPDTFIGWFVCKCQNLICLLKPLIVILFGG